MVSLNNLIRAIDEQSITRNVAIAHDNTRMGYSLKSNTVYDFNEFTNRIAEYYNYHFRRCIVQGGVLSRTEAAGRAKEMLEHAYRRSNGDINTAYNDAHDGTNGGMRVILDHIAEAFKAESIERYIREAFDYHVAPNSWDQKVEIMRKFLGMYGKQLSASINLSQPERYAQNYRDLIWVYVESLKRISPIFRRL